MSYYYNTSKQYSSQEDDNFGDSQDSYLDNDMNQSGSKSSGSMDKESQEYKKRRQKNNEAVRRSREKSKVKYNEKEEQIIRLRNENKKLETAAASLRSELKIYQDLARNLDIKLMDESSNLNNNRMIKVESEFTNY